MFDYSHFRFIFCRRLSWYVLALAMLPGVLDQPVLAQEQGIGVREEGQGSTLVFIPGLNSGSATFDATCAAFIQTHRCVLLQLPGFAGQPAMASAEGFLLPMRDAVIALLHERELENVVLVGHSLGGVLSMMIALEAPDLVDRLVLIDSLPFYPAIQNPDLTADMARPMGAAMRAQMEAQDDETYARGAVASVVGMSRDPARLQQMEAWTLASDRATTIAAMVDMLTTDLRADLAALEQPVLVLGAWAAYEPYGSTLDSTRAIFAAQYARAPRVDIHMSAAGHHFLTWDDPDWVHARITAFLPQ